jgi:hypothetical protein
MFNRQQDIKAPESSCPSVSRAVKSQYFRCQLLKKNKPLIFVLISDRQIAENFI